MQKYKNGHILKASHKIVITYNLDDIDFVICCMDSAKLGLRATMGFLIGASSSASEPEIALTIKSQNIGASTKIVCKQMFHFDILDCNK